MQLNIKQIFTGCLALGIVLTACEREADPTLTTQPVTNGAFVKVVHAAPSFGSIFGVKDSFQLFAGGQKITGPLLTYGGSFPSRTGNGYAQVGAGNTSLQLFFPGVTKADSIELYTLQKELRSGQYYSLIVTDDVKGTNDSTRIWLRDSIETPEANQYNLRFVHAVMNDTADKLVDVFSARRNGNIVTGFKPGQASQFMRYAYNGLVPDTLIVRRTGTNQELARLNTITFGHQRVFTLLYRGNANLTGTAAKARTLTYYLNQ